MSQESRKEGMGKAGAREKARAEDSGSYVVPEPDGVRSGHPLFSSGPRETETRELTPGALHERMVGSRKRAGLASRDDMDPQQSVEQLGGMGGMSIKTKLVGSLSALTLIILVMGVISLAVFRQGSTMSAEVATNHTGVTRLSEDLMALTFRIQQAETEMLAGKEEESFDRIKDYTDKTREKVQALMDKGKALQGDDLKLIQDWSEPFNDLLNRYALHLARLVKEIASDRETIENLQGDVNRAGAELRVKMEANRARMENTMDDFLKETQDGLKGSGPQPSLSRVVLISSLMNDLGQEVGQIHPQAAEALSTGKSSLAESTVASLLESKNLVDRIVRESGDPALGASLSQVQRDLAAYGATFKAGMEEKTILDRKSEDLASHIQQQKAELERMSGELIASGEEITGHMWEEIVTESTQMASMQSRAEWVLAVMMLLGTGLGLTILIAVPRPILTALRTLVAGAEQVAAGDLTRPVQVSSRDEMGLLAQAFERMRINLVSLVDRIQRASVQISTTVNEINAAANQQAATASEQAAAINQFTATLSEMARSAENLAGASDGMSTNAMDVSSWIDESNNNTSLMLESMNAINLSTQQTSDRIKALNDKMDGINDAVSTISGVADQTTLLSLNAAIEANKAGESGKGFSVVSGEIRRLADRSIEAAAGISQMVRDIQRAAENSVVAMDKSSEEIRNGIGGVQKSTERISGINSAVLQIRDQILEISSSVKDQALASQQSQQTVSDLLASSKMVAQAAQQTSAVSYELTAMSNQLSAAVSVFKT
jgi:methyl-accepting chemotaxis protein WspA